MSDDLARCHRDAERHFYTSAIDDFGDDLTFNFDELGFGSNHQQRLHLPSVKECLPTPENYDAYRPTRE
jgi:hypothetical protein